MVSRIGERKMKKVIANKVCEDCGADMFKRGIDVDFNTKMLGWSCPKCFITKWDEIK